MYKAILIFIFVGALSYALYWQINFPDITRVSSVSAQRGAIKNAINLTGKVINDKTVTLSALVNGQITEMKISKGQVVDKNQLLARFDRREADAELTRLQAEQELAQEKAILARNTLDRLLNMGAGGSVSQQQVDDAQTEWRIARAQQKVSKAAYSIAVIQREKYDVTAPFNGVITEKTTEVGQWVEAGTPLFTLVALDGREIEVNIDSSDRGQIKLKQTARLKSDAWPDSPWSETIHWLAPAVSQKDNEALNSFSARLTLGKQAPPLILGQQIDVELMIEHKQDALKIPYSVLIEDGGKKQVAIINSSSQIELRDITTGIEDISTVEVLSGVTAEEIIAVNGESPYKQGQQVIVE